MAEDFYTVRQAASYLGVTRRWVQLLIAKGKLEAVGDGHNRLIAASALENFRRGTPPSDGDLHEAGDQVPDLPRLDGQLGELLAQLHERARQVNFERLSAGRQEEILEAGAAFAHQLLKAFNAQNKRSLQI